MRRHVFDHFNRAHAMGNGDDLVAVHPFALRPGPPLAVHRARGIDQNAVKVKQNCRTMEERHIFLDEVQRVQATKDIQQLYKECSLPKDFQANFADWEKSKLLAALPAAAINAAPGSALWRALPRPAQTSNSALLQSRH